MADTDFNIIKPAEGLQNVQGLSAARRWEEHERRQKPSSQHQESAENQDQPDGDGEEEKTAAGDDSHTIDYCA